MGVLMRYRMRKSLQNYSNQCYAYTPSEVFQVPQDQVIDCSLGVNPYGHSEFVATALEEFIEGLKCKDLNYFYPDASYLHLRDVISKSFDPTCKITADNIRVGVGSIGVLEKVVKIFVDSDCHTLGFCPQFPDFYTQVIVFGGHFDAIPLRRKSNFQINIDEIIGKLSAKYSIVYIDNPSNPTGQIIPVESVKRMAVRAREMGVVVVVDEAYGEFMEKDNSAVNLLSEFDNLIVIKSASKGVGLAGLRLGYIISTPEIIELYDKVNIPFCVSAVAEALFNKAILDERFFIESRKKVADAKKKIIGALKKIKVWETSETTPIMVLEHPDSETDLFRIFLEHNIFVEPHYGFINLSKNCIRIRTASEPENIIEAIRQIEKSI